VSVGSRSDGGREIHGFGAQAAKLRGPKLEVRQASTCKSPRAAERRWRRLVLAVTGTHSSWRYCGAVWWRHLKMTEVYRVNKHPTGCQTGLTTGLTTVLNEQPLSVQHGCQTALNNRFDNRLYTRYNRLSKRFDNRLYRVYKH